MSNITLEIFLLYKSNRAFNLTVPLTYHTEPPWLLREGSASDGPMGWFPG